MPSAPSAFSRIRDLARNDVVVSAKVNGRPLRLVAAPVFEGQPPRVVWSDFLAVLRVKFFRRARMTRILRQKFAAQISTVEIDGRREIAIPLSWAAAAMASEPGLPEGLEKELARAAEAAVSRAGEIILAAIPVNGNS